MKRLCLCVLAWVAALAVVPTAVFAQYASSGYKSNEVQFGSGGDTGQASSNYKAQVSIGSLGGGNQSSSAYQAYSGFLTPNEPFLSITLSPSLVNLGTLSTSSTATGVATMQVTAYVDSGYVVDIVSQPPSTSPTAGPVHTLTGMSTEAASTAGQEQFGINLESNSSPTTFGSAPAPQPNSSYATGIAAPGYNIANEFKYHVGDTIAETNGSGWGSTIYTISYIANESILTPAGTYTMNQDIVVVATY